MIIYNCDQGTDEWRQIRKGKATASQFGKILTPKTMKLSAQSRSYAIKLAAEQLGVETQERPQTEAMKLGIEREPFARDEYAERHGVHVNEVGFICPNDSTDWGMSPDGLIGFDVGLGDLVIVDGLLEIKCPDAETLIEYHLNGVMPPAYVAQVQGQMWVAGAKWCDFFAWHPELEPFEIRVYPDLAYHSALAEALPKFIDQVNQIKSKVQRRELFNIDFGGFENE